MEKVVVAWRVFSVVTPLEKAEAGCVVIPGETPLELAKAGCEAGLEGTPLEVGCHRPRVGVQAGQGLGLELDAIG